MKRESIRLLSKVRQTFTLVNLTLAYFELNRLIEISESYKKSAGALKLPLYKSLCNFCVLLIVYSTLKSKKASGVGDVPIENVTLASIISMSKELLLKNMMDLHFDNCLAIRLVISINLEMYSNVCHFLFSSSMKRVVPLKDRSLRADSS
jgi:hypothetical protein